MMAKNRAGRFTSYFGLADPRQAVIGKCPGSTHSLKPHLERIQNIFAIYCGTSGTGCPPKQITLVSEGCFI